MRFREIVNKEKKVEPAWVFRAKGMVWRLVSADAGMFVGEDRNPDAKAVSFFGLNRVSGEILWEGISFDEAWWIAIEATHRDRVFLHGFSRPDMPDHRRILALDLFTGRVAWSRDDVRYIFAVDDSVFTSKDTATGRTLFELHLRTGSTLRSWENDASELSAARSRAQVQIQEGPEFPVPLEEIPATDQRLDPVQKLCQNENATGPIEVLRKGNACLFSYHEKGKTPGTLRNILNIVSISSGERLFAETLDESVQSVVPDSFFVQDEILYFVKDRGQLTAVNISDLVR